MSDAVPGGEEKVSRRRPWLWLFLCLAVLAAVVYFGGTEYLRLRDELKTANDAAEKSRVAQIEGDASTRVLQDRIHGLEEQLEQSKQEKSAISNEKDALAEDLQKKEQEIARLKATYDQLNDKLKNEIGKGEILLSEANGKIRVDLVDKVLFDSGQADLSPRGQEVLGRVAGVLKDVDDKTIQVSGHTDDSPITDKLLTRYPTNWELSVARAVNVVRFLSEQGKVPQKRLMAAGYGEFRPVASNATAAGRAANRRIEILLAPETEKQSVKLAAQPKSESKPIAKADSPPAKKTDAPPAKKTDAKTVQVKADAKKPAVKVAATKSGTAKKK
ncbi:MAG: OmpA family protein [Myxococcaceae bacterium]